MESVLTSETSAEFLIGNHSSTLYVGRMLLTIVSVLFPLFFLAGGVGFASRFLVTFPFILPARFIFLLLGFVLFLLRCGLVFALVLRIRRCGSQQEQKHERYAYCSERFHGHLHLVTSYAPWVSSQARSDER